MYKHTLNINGTVNETQILRLLDSACIPFDPANTDYQAYLEWLAAGNTPEEAE